jgi:hypothetical protein
MALTLSVGTVGPEYVVRYTKLPIADSGSVYCDVCRRQMIQWNALADPARPLWRPFWLWVVNKARESTPSPPAEQSAAGRQHPDIVAGFARVGILGRCIQTLPGAGGSLSRSNRAPRCPTESYPDRGRNQIVTDRGPMAQRALRLRERMRRLRATRATCEAHTIEQREQVQ